MLKKYLNKIKKIPNTVKTIENIFWLFIEKIVRMLVALVVGIWVARYLGPEQFGALSFAIAFVGIFGSMATLGFQEIIIKKFTENQADKNRIIGTGGILLIISGAIAYIALIALILYLRQEDYRLKVIVIIIGFTLLFKFSEILTYWFESLVQSKYIIRVQLLSHIFFGGIKIILIYKNAELMAFVWITATESIALSLLVVITAKFRGLKFKQLKFQLDKAKKFLLESWPLMLSSVAVMVYVKVDIIMLGQLIGEREVGIYSAATSISQFWYFIPVIIAASIFPTIIDSYNINKNLYNKYNKKLYNLLIPISVIISIIISVFAPSIIEIFYGDKYIESTNVLTIHVWALIFVSLGVVSGKIMIIEGCLMLILERAVIGAFINVIANFILIPKYGAIGAAIATIISLICSNLFYDLLRKKTRKFFFMKVDSLLGITIIKNW